MPITTHTLQAGGKSWTYSTLPATKGLEVFTQLTGILGSATGALAGSLPSGGKIEDIDLPPDVMAKALGAIGEKLAEPGTIPMIRKLLENLQEGSPPALKPVNFELEFAGNYGTLLAIVQDALQQNFSSFFAGNPGFAAIARSLGSTSPEQST